MEHPLDLRRARVAVTVAYVGQGVSFAALVTRIPALQEKFGLSDGALGLLVGLVPIIAGVGSVLAGAMVERRGSRAVLRVMGPVVPAALVVVGLAPDIPVLLVGLVALGFGLGAVDAAMNIAAVRVQDDLGRSLVAGFYAAWSLAGFVGALLASAAAGTTLSLGVFFAGIAVVLVPVQLLVGPWLLPGHPTPQVLSSEQAVIRWRPVMLVGIALMCVYIADSGASTFSADYLHKGLGSTQSVAALAFAAYALMTVIGRLIVDRTVDRIGPVPLVRTGGVVAVVAAAGIALAPSPAFALAAFALLGLGICPAIPLAFTAAASHDKTSSGLAVARVNVFNYVGFVVGAPLIGGVAEGASLRWAFAVLVPVLLVVPLLAGWFRVAPHEAPDHDGHLLGETA
ncbi:MAG TPA: MFS transporter [Candidatus Nanopelagicales bacterium]|nr:MFS transporter [Candidatus Nanopelagicales bacterium]